jgi:hypothetical protein
VRHALEKAGKRLWAKLTDTPGEFRENRIPALLAISWESNEMWR